MENDGDDGDDGNGSNFDNFNCFDCFGRKQSEHCWLRDDEETSPSRLVAKGLHICAPI